MNFTENSDYIEQMIEMSDFYQLFCNWLKICIFDHREKE